MAGAVGKYAANKFLKKQMKQYGHKDVASDYVSLVRFQEQRPEIIG
jgi:hypothetical protein